MANPCLVAAPFILSAAGTGASMAANAQSERQMERRVQQELARQAQFQTQANAAYQASAKQSTPDVAKKQISEGAQGRESGYEMAQAVPLTQSTAKAAVTNPQQMSTAATVGASNKARAQNMGYEDWLLQQLIKNMQAGQNLGVINNLAQGSQNVLPFELQAAQHAGDDLRAIGSLASLAGGVWGMGNMAGGVGPCTGITGG